ncbi:G2/mitotic-specific cyclin CLB2 [Cyberlindnera fabianii]|uniref:G2/mitotic-specific cyclin CLB2 n=1 Tax=Cyberlindnera fabianii TaxID=36022 RepID=A0A1V2KZN9_CYBFA|nr:G2/mitotic-specific cyclin CLB2 [Cyberlindnera fabianii]
MSENTAAHGPVRDENAIIKRSKPLTDSKTTTTRQLRKPDAKVSSLAPAASLGPSQASTTGPTTTRQALTNVTNTSTATSRIHTTTKVQTRSKTAAAAAASTVKDNDNKDKPRVGTKRSATQLDEQTDVKRSKTEQEWEDLDKFDLDDPLMVCEYVNDIFEYFSRLEISTLPDPKYLEWQKGLKPKMRSILVDWIVEVHLRFRLLPETLFLAINIMDRFMSKETVQVDKLQLLATGSLFIAAKYEEVYSPSVKNYSYVTDGGYTEEDILNAERYILQVLEFDLSYPNPNEFLKKNLQS